MKRAEAVDAAMKTVADGRTAFICHDGGLRVGREPSGRIILAVPPERPRTRETLMALLAHRMRMTGVNGN